MFGFNVLETLPYRTVQNVFRYLEPFRSGWRVWQTDGRTGRTGLSNSAVGQ